MDEALSSGTGGRAPGPPPGIDLPRGFAARVSPAGLSGSWIDVLPMSDGRKGVVLGCCAEPSTAPRLRAGARETLQRTGDPVLALNGIDGQPVSAVCAVIDRTAVYYYSTHTGSATVVTAPPTPCAPLRDGRLVVCDLAPGATVLLSTSPVPDAQTHLSGGAAAHPDELADRIITAAAALPAVVTVLYRHPPAPMSVTMPASPPNLAVSRNLLREWLAEAGVGPESSADILLAVGEATANATEHSVLGRDHEVSLTVTAALDGDLLELVVSDDGQWKPATMSPGHRGHGIHLINALVDSVDLTTTSAGTTVSMRKELA